MCAGLQCVHRHLVAISQKTDWFFLGCCQGTAIMLAQSEIPIAIPSIAQFFLHASLQVL